MKNIIVILVLVLGFNSCMLDEQIQEDSYKETLTNVLHHGSKKYITDKMYMYFKGDGSYIYVTIDDDSNVYDLDGNYIFTI